MIKSPIILCIMVHRWTQRCVLLAFSTYMQRLRGRTSLRRGGSHGTEDPQSAETEKESTVRRPLSVTSRSLQFTAGALLNATLARSRLNFELLLHEVHKMLPNLPFTHQAECA